MDCEIEGKVKNDDCTRGHDKMYACMHVLSITGCRSRAVGAVVTEKLTQTQTLQKCQIRG